MRTWFWTLLLASLAVALAILLQDHGGNVLILMPPWRIELSLALAVLLGLGLLLLIHLILRLFGWLSHGPERLRGWRGARAGERDNALLESAWMHVLQGHDDQACKDLSKLLTRALSPRRRTLAALALARVQHHGGHHVERDQALEQAKASADTPRLQTATAIAGAAMLLDHGSAEAALLHLQTLPDASAREPYASRLLLQAQHQLGHHEQVYDLAHLLWRRGILDKTQALTAIEAATVARLAACDGQAFKTVWGALKSGEKTLPAVALSAAALHADQGEITQAERILETAITATVTNPNAPDTSGGKTDGATRSTAHDGIDTRLLAAYAQCPPERVAHRLSRAEGWLKAHPDHPDLLATLGNLCLIGQLWGQGERYLRRSLRLRPDPRVIALLGNLYDRIGRMDDAVRQWRLAANIGLPALTLAEPHVLPAADTRDDPGLLDVASPVPEDLFEASAPIPNTEPALKETHES